MIQGIADLHVHEIEYYDDLTGTSTVDGFADGVDLDTAPGTGDEGDIDDITFLDTTADVSVLGGGETNAGSGNLYVGFNPISPSKTFSFGVGLELSGGDTEAVAEWIDLNGDNLPDKVFLDGSTVKFRLNTTGASGAGDDGDWPLEDVSGINELSKNSNFAFQVSAEAYPLVALGLGTGLGFSWSNTYFSDVNGDGLEDFVTGGTVHFNALDEDGVPTFSTSSADTPIPLDPSPLPSLSSAELAEIGATLDLQSPPIDTVRRFIAPFTGQVLIDAAVALDSLGATSGDGVRVAVQHNDTEVDTAVLAPDGTTSAFGSAIPLTVNAGDRIYFRTGAIDDGVNDSVAWNPVITYQSPTWPELDANGQSQWVFAAQSDFTLAGRPQDFVAMPYTGTALVEGAVVTSAALTDKLTVTAVKRDPSGVDTSLVLATIPAGTAAGTFPFNQQIPVGVRRRRFTGRPVRDRLLGHHHLRGGRPQRHGRRGVRTPHPAPRRDLPVLQPHDWAAADRPDRYAHRPGRGEGAAGAGRRHRCRCGDHGQVGERPGDQDGHDAHRAPRRHRLHTERDLGQLLQRGRQVGRRDDPRQRVQPRRPDAAEVRDRRRDACRRDAGAQRRAPVVRDAGHLPPALSRLGHRRLHRR
jgi:hypothetical protein